METEQVTQTEQIVSPAGEVVSPSQIAETITTEAPAVSMEDRELQDAHAAIEQAKTPEDKERAREGYQRRVEAKETKEIKERARALELENARLQGRMEAMGQAGQQVQPQIVQEPVIPAPQLLSMPTREQFTKDVDGYPEFDEPGYLAEIGRVAQENAVRTVKHESQIQQAQSEEQANAQKGKDWYTRVCTRIPEFRHLTGPQSLQPTPAIAKILVDLEAANPEIGAKVAYHLAKNSGELAKLNEIHPFTAAMEIGKLAARLPDTPPPKTTTNASPPIVPVTPSAPTAPIDFTRLSVEEIIAERNREEFGR